MIVEALVSAAIFMVSSISLTFTISLIGSSCFLISISVLLFSRFFNLAIFTPSSFITLASFFFLIISLVSIRISTYDTNGSFVLLLILGAFFIKKFFAKLSSKISGLNFGISKKSL